MIFIIPVDDSALRKHLISMSKKDNTNNYDHEAEEFLRKFFDITIRIKPYQTVEMYEFADSINTKYQLNFTPNTIDIISKEYARNPRRIIQCFNNLSVELNSYSDEHAVKYESIICKLLIIREEYPNFYRFLAFNPHIIQWNTDFPEKSEFENQYPELKIFLNTTRVISQDLHHP